MNGRRRVSRTVSALVAVVAAGLTLLAGRSTAAAVPPPAGAIVVGAASPTCTAPAFATIQAAVDAAASGATIYVCPGTYDEAVTIADKALTLLGNQWGVDARTGRTVPGEESVLGAGPAGNAVTLTGAATVEIDGFTLSGSATAVFAINGGAAHEFVNNIVEGNSVGFNFNTAGPADTNIRSNRFVANNLPGPNAGSSIFVTNGSVAGLVIEENLFQGNVGDGASSPADINTPGGATSSSGIVIRNNISVDDTTFLVANNTSGTEVTANSITQTNPAASVGSAIVLFGTNDDMVISGNTIDGGAANGIRTGSFTTGGTVTISGNQIANRLVGIRLGVAGSLTATISANTVTNSTTAGIWLEATIAGAVVDANTVSSAGGTDCQDDSTGSGTVGTANTWTANIGATSAPPGLCAQPPPTTTTTTPTTTTTTAPGSSTTDPGSARRRPIANTGSGLLPMTVLGAALVAVGLALVASRRRGHGERRT
jgi:hypothetical protein